MFSICSGQKNVISIVYRTLILQMKLKLQYGQCGDLNAFFHHLVRIQGVVAILFNNNFKFKVLKEKKDINGNYLILDVIVEKERFTLTSLYGPNTDSHRFF